MLRREYKKKRPGTVVRNCFNFLMHAMQVVIKYQTDEAPDGYFPVSILEIYKVITAVGIPHQRNHSPSSRSIPAQQRQFPRRLLLSRLM